MDIKNLEIKFKETVSRFEEDLKNIRTGRAHTSIVEGLIVDVYGAKMPLSHIAALSTPDAKSIIIKPWDKTNLPAIESAIQKSSLGLAPISDKDQIRLSIPPLTEERRKDMAKVIGKKMEEARISVRQERDGVWKKIQEDEREGTISENERFSDKEKLEKLVGETNAKIADIAGRKEKEIMEI